MTSFLKRYQTLANLGHHIICRGLCMRGLEEEFLDLCPVKRKKRFLSMARWRESRFIEIRDAASIAG